MEERERKHERAPLCLHQIEKVSFSGEKCCTSLSLSMSYRGVGMLLITRERVKFHYYASMGGSIISSLQRSVF